MSLRCNAFITVMETAQLRDCCDPADTGDLPREWTLFAEPQMRSGHPRQTDPEQPIPAGQHRSFPLSPKGYQLQPESCVLDRNGLMTAQQESYYRQKKGWHVSR